MSRRGAVLAARNAAAQRGLAGNSQGAAAAPGSAPSGLLQTLGINSSSGQTLQHTGGWGNAYGGGSLPRPPATFTDGAYGPFSPTIPVPLDEGDPPYGLPPARREQYRVGWNLPVGEPGTEGIKLCTFETLRSLADLYSVARACIQYLKSEITSLEWDIMPTKAAAKAMGGTKTGRKSAAKDFGKRRAEAVGFFNRPDLDYFSWQSWLSVALEEMLVYDALSLVVRQKWGKGMKKGLLGSDLHGLELISGSTVRPLYDIHGATPRPPAPAYQQYLYGVPRVDMMTMITERDIEEAGMQGAALGAYKGDQLLYLPYTPRRWTPYGFSPIERGLVPIISGLSKQGYQLDFFKEGTVPAVYISPGQEMNPTQIRELQTALNAVAGDPAYHHKIIVLPTGSKVDPQRPAALADQFDEIVMSQVCMAFGVQPMQIGISPKVSTTQSPGAANQMAKASANNQDQGSLQPTLIFLSTIMERVLAVMCGQTDMRFMFDGMQEEEDEETSTNLVVNQTTHALKTIDEGREKLGMEPYGIPESKLPGFLVATGWTPLAGSAEAAQQQRDLAAQPPPAPIVAGDPKLTRQALTAPNGKPPASLTAGRAKPGAPAAGSGKKAPAATGTASTQAAQGAAAAQRSNPQAASKAAGTDAAAPPADQQPVPPPQDETVRDVVTAVAAAALAKALMGLMLDLYVGKITILQAVADGILLMADGYRQIITHATMAAAGAVEGTPPLDDHAVTALADTLAERQRPYITTMAKAVTVAANSPSAAGLIRDAVPAGSAVGDPAVSDVIDAPGRIGREAHGGPQDDLNWLPARTRTYGSTLTGAWNEAYGTTVTDAHPQYAIVWRIGETEHCPLCLARDGQEFTMQTLPGWPGDGDFGGPLCLGGPNCGCHLDYMQDGKLLRQSFNTQRPESVAYYAQQLADITAHRKEMAERRAAFVAELPAGNGIDGTSAQGRAMNRDQLRTRLAQLANARIRQTGGYTGISVEPGDIPAKIIASLLPQYGAQPNAADLPITALMDAVESMFVGRYSRMDITKSAFTAIMLASLADMVKVGPKGYIHGWIKVGSGADGVMDNMDALRKRHPGVQIDAHKSGDHVHLSLIRTPESERGSGKAGRALDDLLHLADHHGTTVSLTPEPLADDRKTKKTRLTSWYKSKGFVPNAGRNKDYSISATMLRNPQPVREESSKVADIGDLRAVTAEMEACARHLAKGRAAADWRREHLTVDDVDTLADLTQTGALSRAECVKAALNRRYVTIDGQIIEPETPEASLVQGSAAGGGGNVLLPHDEHGIYHDDMSSPRPRPTLDKVGPKGYVHGWLKVGDAADSLGMHTDSGGKLTPKRAALHEKLISATLAGHESEQHPVATFLGGGPASGKTSVMRDTQGMVIAADDLKFQLPEYKRMLKNGDKRAAAFTHEESSHMTGNLVAEASKRKVSFVLDGLGDSGIDKLTKKVESIRAAGHRVDAKYVTVDTEEAVRRAKARAQKTGFLVPETSMRASHAAVSRTFKAAIDRNLFDRAELWDNNGTEPKLIGRKLPDGPWQVHDQAAWQKFLAKGQEA